MSEILRKASIAQGLILSGKSVLDQIRAGHKHRWGKLQKLIDELFMLFMKEVTEHEVELLKILRLPDIDTVREAELENTESEEGKFRYTQAMDAQVKSLFLDWTEELIGTDLAKQVDPGSALYPFYMMQAFSFGLEKFKDLIRDELGAPSEEELERIRAGLTATNPYLSRMMKEGAKRIKTELAIENMRTVRRALIRMSREGEYPLTVARWLHKKVGEGSAYYWRRIAMSESGLALDSAFDASMHGYRIPMSEWSASPTACEICAYLDGKVWRIDEGPRPIHDTHPYCFPKWTKVFTPKGYVQIDNVRVGDRVLTHKGKFRKIIQTHKRFGKNEKMVELAYINSDYMANKPARLVSLILTENHPILINGQWVNAGDVQVGDSVSLLATRCKTCNQIIPYSRWRELKGLRSEFCSQTCNTLGTEKKYGGQYLTEQCHDKTRKMIADRTHPFMNKNSKSKANAANSRIKYNTNAEQALMQALDKYGIGYVRQFMIKRPEKRPCSRGGEMNRFYKTDFAIPQMGIVIECNGEYWHDNEQYDNKRKQFIESKGFTVIEFKNDDIFRNANGCAEEVLRMMANHSGQYEFMDMEIVSVAKYEEPKIWLYNLSVDEDESYIAKGFVVHNCLCVRYPKYVTQKPVQERWLRPSPYEKPYTSKERELLRRQR